MAGGIVIAGVGIGGFIYSITSTAFINPKNLEGTIIVMDGVDTEKFFTADVADNFPYGMRMMCILYACVCFIAVLLVRMPGPKYKNILLKRE